MDSASDGRPSPTPDLTDDSVVYNLPPRVQLGESFARGSSDIRVVNVPTEALQVPHGYVLWRGGQDSLHLILSTGHAGTHTALIPEGRLWTGTATTFDDDGRRARFARPVQLDPVSCTSPPPIPATADRALRRQVELESGRVLILGRPMPPGLPASVGTVEVDDDAVEPWQGTDRILVSLTPDSVVMRIELRYGDEHNLEPLLRILEADHGTQEPAPLGSSRVWRNRTTVVHLQREGLSRLMLHDPRLWPYGWAVDRDGL